MIRVNEDGSYSGPAAEDMVAGQFVVPTEPPPPVGFRPYDPYRHLDGPTGMLTHDVKKGKDCRVIRKAEVF